MDSLSTPPAQRATTECARLEPAPLGETRRQRVRRVVGFVWPLFVIPAVLTALFFSFGWFGWRVLPVAFAMNTLVTLCIGGSIVLIHNILPKRLACVRPIWLAHTLGALATIGGVVGGAELAIRSLDLLSRWVDMSLDRATLIGVGLVIAAVIWAIEFTYERLRQRARAVELREEQAQRQTLRAQFEALQARTNPHFLYNSLNTVAGLIEEDPRRAEQALEKLSDLLRYALDGSRRAQVRLSDELQNVRGYLEMEELRFGSRLHYRIDAGDAVGDLAVPPLILQPLVENAVLHGIGTRTEGGTVHVEAAQTNGVLHLIVEDDGPGPGGSQYHGSRTSLDELSQRLLLLYGDRAAIESDAVADGGFRVHLRIPATRMDVPG